MSFHKSSKNISLPFLTLVMPILWNMAPISWLFQPPTLGLTFKFKTDPKNPMMIHMIKSFSLFIYFSPTRLMKMLSYYLEIYKKPKSAWFLGCAQVS